jgi:hypothetical protein
MVLISTMLLSSAAFGANPWLTSRTINDQTEPLSFITTKSAEELAWEYNSAIKYLPSADTTGLIDIVVSIHTNWAGDNDGNSQGGAGNVQQDKIERIIQHMADSVFEATDGGHRLRNVYIYQKGKAASFADVVWSRRGHPHVPLKGGVGMPGGHINMYDIFKDGAGAGTDYDMLADEEGSGYTLSHEMGHYFYGLYDEYKLQATDETVKPAIMNRQWNAKGGNYKWLNMSIAHQTNNPTGPYVNTKKTAQHRAFGESCWETLARTTTADPSNLILGTRVYYPEVAAKAPSGTNSPLINLPSALAREKLNIVWMSSNLVIQIVIDRSGSMSGILGNALTAAKLLVDLVEIDSYVGVIDYDDAVTTLVPITKITNENQKTAIKAQIDTLYDRGATAIGDAALAALNGILATGITNATRAVFLLTDGHSNTGIDPLTVIPLYQKAKIPIIGFGYGGNVDPSLPQMALATGGKYYSSPTTLSSIANAFHDANSYVAGSPTISSGSAVVGGKPGKNRNIKIKFLVDNTLSAFDLVVTSSGTTDVSSFSLQGPGKKAYAPKSSDQTDDGTLVFFTVNNVEPGKWKVSGAVEGGSEVTYQVSGKQNQQTYGLVAYSPSGNDVTFPASLQIAAVLQKDLPIKRARLSAMVTTPDGSKWFIKKMENTEAGMYTAPYAMYTEDGAYNVDVYAQSRGGKFTYDGASMAIPEGTSDLYDKNIKDQKVRDKFTRVATFQVQVNNVSYSPVGSIAGPPKFMWPLNGNALGYKLEVQLFDTTPFLKKSVSRRKGYYQANKAFEPGVYRWRVGTKVKTKKGAVSTRKTETIWSWWQYFTQQ